MWIPIQSRVWPLGSFAPSGGKKVLPSRKKNDSTFDVWVYEWFGRVNIGGLFFWLRSLGRIVGCKRVENLLKIVTYWRDIVKHLKTTKANKSWLHLFFFNKEQDHPIHKSTSCWNVRLSDLCICAILNITLSTEPFSTSTTEKNYIDKSFPRPFLWSKKSRAKHKIYINLRRQAGLSKPNERLMGFDISADLVTPCSRGINLTFERLCCSIEM